MTTSLDLIRHGTPEGGNRYRGHSIDDPLSEKGWQQMNHAVEGLVPWDVIVSSPMKRCSAFAQSYAVKHHLQLSIDDDLKEIGFGAWEGRSSAEVLAEDPAAIHNFYHDPVTYRPDGAEPVDAFLSRVGDCLESITEKFTDKRILIVAHAGVLRAAIAHTLGAPASAMYRISIGNAAIINIQDDGVRPPTLKL